MPLYDPDDPPSATHLFAPTKPRGKPPQSIEVVRALDVGDIDTILTGEPLVPTTQKLSQLRTTHHSLARHLAKGVSITECSVLTGYSTNYISSIQKDPLFKELLDYYGKQVEIIHVDALERMRNLGIDTLEELQRQLTEEPEKFSIREKMELVELCLVKPAKAAAAAGHGGGGGPSSITIKFASPGPPAPALPESNVRTIDHDPS
jgi:hypothetical protein